MSTYAWTEEHGRGRLCEHWDDVVAALRDVFAGRAAPEGSRGLRGSSVEPRRLARDRCRAGAAASWYGDGCHLMTIEDQTGSANVVVWSSLFERQRRVRLVLHAPLISSPAGVSERSAFDPSKTWRRRRCEEIRVLSALERRYLLDFLAQIEAADGYLSDELFVASRRMAATGSRRTAKPLSLLVKRGLPAVSTKDGKPQGAFTKKGRHLIRRWFATKPPDFHQEISTTLSPAQAFRGSSRLCWRRCDGVPVLTRTTGISDVRRSWRRAVWASASQRLGSGQWLPYRPERCVD